jgi:HlyD family secretion protein
MAGNAAQPRPSGRIKCVAIVVLALAILGTAGALLFRRPAHSANTVSASGIIEARTLELASEVSGTIVERPIEKGQAISSGSLVAVIASETTAADLKRAEASLAAAEDQSRRAQEAVRLQQGTSSADVQRAAAGLDTARARYSDIEAGPRPQEVQAAEAAVAQATAARGAAAAQLKQLHAGLRPEEIRQAEEAHSAATDDVAAAQAHLADLVAGARPQELADAQAQVSKAQAAVEKTGRDYARAKALIGQGAVAPAQLDAYQAASDAAQADLASARQRLELLRSGTRAEQVNTAKAQLARAQAQERATQAALALARQGPRQEEIERGEQSLAQTTAALEAARANLRLLREGARVGQRAAASGQVGEARGALQLARANERQVQVRQAEAQAAVAQVEQARAVVEAARANQEKFRLVAPVTGVIDDTHLRVGEVVRPGSAVATLVDLADTWVTVYVPEPELARIVIGSNARVYVDGYPGKAFYGRVRRISQQAEFTPKFVQTQEERARTVFAVEIAVPNEQGLLKPGMPADAIIDAVVNVNPPRLDHSTAAEKTTP